MSFSSTKPSVSAWLGRLRTLPFPVVAAFLVTLAVYGACAHFGTAVWGNDDPKEAVYNRMIDGFAQGHLSLARDVPAGFASLRDPYDPKLNADYRTPPYLLYDLSYYHGKLYAYFGPAPALLLFWPYHLVTGRYLSYKAAAMVFCASGLIAMAGLLLSIRRRYAPETPAWVVALLLLSVGLANGLPTLLARVDIWEIPIAGTTALILWVIVALWQAWHQADRRAGWLAVASSGLGLAVATRPTAILCTPVLLLPLIREWRQNRWARGGRILAGAAIPFLVCFGAILLFNAARFDSPWEFGQRYQLAAGEYEGRIRQFSFSYVWDNIRVYFLNFTPWTATAPFIGEMPKIAFHTGHAEPEFNFGVLGDVPIVWFALSAWGVRKRRDGLSYLAGISLWVALAQIGLLMLFFGAVSRYEVEVLTPLLLLAAIGLLAAETRTARRALVRGLWIALAAVSVAFNVCHAADHAVRARMGVAHWFIEQHQLQKALEHFDVVLLLAPQRTDVHRMKGIILGRQEKWNEAIAEFQTVVRAEPRSASAYCNLGLLYLEIKDPGAAREALETSLELNSNEPHARAALVRAVRMQWEQGDAAGR